MLTSTQSLHLDISVMESIQSLFFPPHIIEVEKTEIVPTLLYDTERFGGSNNYFVYGTCKTWFHA